VNEVPPAADYVSPLDVEPAVEPALQAAPPTPDLTKELRELVGATRELVALTREQVEYSKRNEERYQRQQQAQREEFQRWLADHRDLGDQCGRAQEVLRTMLGNAIRDLVDYIEEHKDNLVESDFVRSDLIDRFGSVLNHVSSMYGVVKRLSAIENSQKKSKEGK
jgi:hypothetical protein